MDNWEAQDALDPIAIIGMSGRFPGAKNVDEFWHNLQNGLESISFFSDEELVASGIDRTLLNNPNYVKAGTVLADIDLFDAPFFNLTPREAEVMSPQHRLFLECAWEALEIAGYNAEAYNGRIGIYAGAGENTYFLRNLSSNHDLLKSLNSLQIVVGNNQDSVPTQVSYKLNLKGPSVYVNTACSTSLVAVQMACQSLLNYQCDIALAGGISVRVPQKEGYLYQEGGITSPDGHCRAFDARAKGTIFGNGIGIVVLKRLEDALADGDCIHAIIKGSAINNDGATKVGYTAPSVEGQAAVIAEAMALAGVAPETITYIEAHGTGTALGDPIEITALTQAFRFRTQNKGFCAISSVKTNVGHLNTAAGVAGLLKTVLALKHKLLPPSLHFEQPNRQIDFANSPFYVNTTLTEWKTNGTPRRAGVSSFGIGGTNAHAVLEEAPPLAASGKSRPWQLLLLSAKTSTALDRITANLAEHLKQNSSVNLADVAYTFQAGRKAFSYRKILVCQTLDEAARSLSSSSPQVLTNHQDPKERSIVFMFSGQGAQYVNMGRELYQVEPTFREQVDRCSEFLKPLLNLDLRHLLYPKEGETEEAARQLQQTAITQPTLFVIEYALAQLWQSWGVRPQAMIGHSIGEYVAACLSGVFSLEDALALVAARGQLMQQLPPGAMLAVPLSEQEVQPLLGQELSLAAINGSSLCVVSGREEAVEVFQKQLAERGVEGRRLQTSHAFHSEMMEPLLVPFTERVKQVSLNSPQIPYLSNVTGTWITAAQATDPNYWARHLRQTVHFTEGLQQVLKDPEAILLEVGPGRTLTALAIRHPDKSDEQVVLASLRHPQDRQSDVAFLLTTLGQLWLTGAEVDWSGFSAHERRHRLPLPTYPFERQRYWIDPQNDGKTAPASSLFGKRPDIADWFYIPSWKRSWLSVQKTSVTLGDSGCLVFMDECGLGSQLGQKLKQQGQEAIAVRVGPDFTKLTDRLYTLNPRQPEHYDALLNELRALNQIPQTIIHLWSVTPADPSELEIESVDSAQDLGFYSLLFLAQAIRRHNFKEEFQIAVVSNNLQEVTGEELLRPEKATVLGPLKGIPQEFPNLTCRSIDIVIPCSESQEAFLIDQLLEELSAQSSDLVVAYRGNHRWVQTFEPTRLDRSTEATPSLREGGVYLITGGLGRIGLVLAEYLAKTVRAKLILTGRSALPPRDEWEQWLATHEAQDSVSQKIRKLQELENLGAEVLVVHADVANQQQMQEAIVQAEKQFGSVHGVIHAAGILTENASRSIEKTGKAEAEQQFLPKVQGLLVLEKVLHSRELDFCLLMSSLSSVLGGLRLVAYSAANLFMDAFAHQQNQAYSVVPWLSVNWDSWQLEETTEQSTALGATVAELAMLPQEGVDAFQRVLSTRRVPQVIVSTGNIQTRIDQWIKLESLREANYSHPKVSESRHARPNLRNTYVAPTNEVEQTLADLWQRLLGVEQVGINDNFFELGGHSVLAIQLLSWLRDTFQVELTVNAIFDAPTVAELAVIIRKNSSAMQENFEKIDQMLHLVENLSEEELEALLIETEKSLKE